MTGTCCPPSRDHFQTTLWTVVRQAGSDETALARVALEELCRAYWHPLYCYARRRGHAAVDAQDLVQGLFAELIAGKAFQQLCPSKGRFRAYLLAAMNHYMTGEYDRRRAAKRGGSHFLLSLDASDAEERFLQIPATALSPEREFDRRWALAVLARALETLAAEQSAAGRGRQFDLLRPFLTDLAQRSDYSQAASQLDVTTNAVAVAIHRLRQRYQELVRAEVAGTVSTVSEAEVELRELIMAMRG